MARIIMEKKITMRFTWNICSYSAGGRPPAPGRPPSGGRGCREGGGAWGPARSPPAPPGSSCLGPSPCATHGGTSGRSGPPQPERRKSPPRCRKDWRTWARRSLTGPHPWGNGGWWFLRCAPRSATVIWGHFKEPWHLLINKYIYSNNLGPWLKRRILNNPDTFW